MAFTSFCRKGQVVAMSGKPFVSQRKGSASYIFPRWNGNLFRIHTSNIQINICGRKAGLYRADKNIPRAFLGVGAPEAVLVGVVALVLFGPKGLAQAAKSLGQAVKAVAPTLKELTDISSDLKSTIEDEIGLSEIRDELQSTLTPIAKPTAKDAFNDKDDFDDPDIMAKREESAKLAWSGGERYTEEVDQNKNVDSMSVEELEAEILRRKVSDS